MVIVRHQTRRERCTPQLTRSLETPTITDTHLKRCTLLGAPRIRRGTSIWAVTVPRIPCGPFVAPGARSRPSVRPGADLTLNLRPKAWKVALCLSLSLKSSTPTLSGPHGVPHAAGLPLSMVPGLSPLRRGTVSECIAQGRRPVTWLLRMRLASTGLSATLSRVACPEGSPAYAGFFFALISFYYLQGRHITLMWLHNQGGSNAEHDPSAASSRAGKGEHGRV